MIVVLSVTTGVALAGTPSKSERHEIAGSFARLPLRFERNDGQFAPRVKFLSRGPGYAMWLTAAEAVVALQPDDNATPPSVVRMRMIGSRHHPKITGEEELTSRVHYLRGNDSREWRSSVAHYSRVRYAGVYRGIDVVYYGNQEQLEYDFIIAPGADPGRVRMEFAGASSLRIDHAGDLIVGTAAGDLRQQKPVAYQTTNASRQLVDVHYAIDGRGEVSFRLGSYDPRKRLVIDPVLAYSTYLGGGAVDFAQGIAVDGSGSAYVCGYTLSADFPTTDALQRNFGGGQDAFVAKLNPAGTALVYSTYIGGSAFDVANSVAVDAAGNAYVTGWTASTNFPTRNPLQATKRQGNDAFVLKLDPSGSALVYSTYLGGSGEDIGYYRLAVDRDGNAHITGTTTSPDFPLVNAFQSTRKGASDYFVAKLNAAGSALVYSTLLGGSGDEGGLGNGVAVDDAGNAYVTGRTASRDFPVLNPIMTFRGGSCGNSGDCHDAFVTKLSPAGTLVYSTYLGGTSTDIGFVVAVDAAGSAYVVGTTGSADFPIRNAFQSVMAGGGDGFVTKIDPSGSSIVYSTFLGGSGVDFAEDLALDSAGNAYVTGFTQSSNFPTRDAFQGAYGGQRTGFFEGDAFVTKLNGAGSDILFSSYLGGSGDEFGSIAVDPNGNAYLAGNTSSVNFPTMSPLQASNRGGDDFFVGGDAFVTKVASGSLPRPRRRAARH